jgi:hypothetical protein
MDALLNWLTKLDLRRSQFCKWSDLVSTMIRWEPPVGRIGSRPQISGNEIRELKLKLCAARAGGFAARARPRRDTTIPLTQLYRGFNTSPNCEHAGRIGRPEMFSSVLDFSAART